MVVITDITVPAAQFALGRLLDVYPDIEIELVRLVQLREGVIPLFWVEGDDPAEIEATIREDPMAESVTYLTKMGERDLFEITWNGRINALVQPLIGSGAEVLRAEGTQDAWEFRLQFEDRDQLAEFRTQCQEKDVHIHLDALYNPALPEREASEGLTDQQYDIIDTAYENGYWDIPQGITLGELADRIGISSNAASQRMRRGLSTLVGQAIRADYSK